MGAESAGLGRCPVLVEEQAAFRNLQSLDQRSVEPRGGLAPAPFDAVQVLGPDSDASCQLRNAVSFAFAERSEGGGVDVVSDHVSKVNQTNLEAQGVYPKLTKDQWRVGTVQSGPRTDGPEVRARYGVDSVLSGAPSRMSRADPPHAQFRQSRIEQSWGKSSRGGWGRRWLNPRGAGIRVLECGGESVRSPVKRSKANPKLFLSKANLA